MSKKEDAEPWTVFGKFAAWLVLWPASIAARAIVAKAYWGWFILPAFGVAVPTYAVCLGVMGFLSFATVRLDQWKDEDASLLQILFRSILFSIVCYVFGWVTFAYGGYFG